MSSGAALADRASPHVSVIIPVLNEAGHIGRCLDSLFANDYPLERLEILVVDGGSTDGTLEVLKGYTGGAPEVRILHNPAVIIPSALNIGIREATGAYIVRVDAHGTYSSNYISESVKTLETTEAAAVGGVQLPVGHRLHSRALAAVMQSPLGISTARASQSEPAEVDTIWLGAWRASTIREVGGFDEDWPVNQDYELNSRLRLAGGRIVLSPDFWGEYVVRGTLTGITRQYFRYGMWRMKTLKRHPHTLHFRQFAPVAAVLGLVGSAALAPLSPYVFPAFLGAYLLGIAAIATLATKRPSAPLLPLVIGVLALTHLSWGVGALVGVIRFGPPMITPRGVLRSLRQGWDNMRWR